jgi:hypothetical protein
MNLCFYDNLVVYLLQLYEMTTVSHYTEKAKRTPLGLLGIGKILPKEKGTSETHCASFSFTSLD